MEKKKRFVEFLKKYSYTLIFSIILLVSELVALRSFRFLYPLSNIFLLLLLFAFLAKIKNPFSYILAFVPVVLMSIDWAFVIHFRSPMGVGNIASAFETDGHEAAGFMQGAVLLIWVACLTLSLFFSFKMMNELRGIRPNKKAIALTFVLFCIGFTAHTLRKGYTKSGDTKLRFMAMLHDQPVVFTYTLLSDRLPVLLPSVAGLCIYVQERNEFNNNKNNARAIPQGISYNSTLPHPTKIYLVLGESALRTHLSLYGYELKTTPFLDSLAVADTLGFAYYTAISPAPITRDALRFALSFATPFNKDAFFNEKNIVEMAKQAGYETYWYSNQASKGMYDYYPAFVAKTSDHTFFSNEDAPDSNICEDFNLINELKKQNSNGKKQFVVLHLFGSHLNYKAGTDKTDLAYFEQKNYPENEYCDYDRSIHHTDRLLHELANYTMQTDSNSVILYYSDHGEIINLGHGIANAGKAQFEIPFVCIANKTALPFKSIIARYIDNRTGLINSTNAPYILSQMMGYEVDQQVVDKAIEDSEYVYHADGKIYKFEDIGTK